MRPTFPYGWLIRVLAELISTKIRTSIRHASNFPSAGNWAVVPNTIDAHVYIVLERLNPNVVLTNILIDPTDGFFIRRATKEVPDGRSKSREPHENSSSLKRSFRET